MGFAENLNGATSCKRLWLGICCSFHLLTLAHSTLPVETYAGYEVDWMSSIIRAAKDEINLLKTLVDSQLVDEPVRPRIPCRFAADINFTSYDPGWVALPVGYPATGKGFFAQDAEKKAMRVLTIRDFPGMGQLYTNLTALVLENASYHITGGNDPICRQLHLFGQQRYSDFFSWAADPDLSEYIGQRVVAGRACNLWILRSTHQSKISLCADGNAPVELNMTLPKNNSGGTSFNISYQFGPLKATPVPEQFEKPQICDKPAPPCENGRGLDPVVLDAYIFHPGMTAGDYNIEDQNVADLAGDAIFICVDRLQKETSFIDHNYTLISRYNLEVSPAFGQYALCNGYPDTKPPGPSCTGGDSRLVGRQAPSSVGDGESRCAADNPLGFWFTLPKGGRCPPGQRASRDAWASGCTWSVQKRLKTIQQSCLLKEHGFLKYCMVDAVERKGFARTNQVLQAAFASEDPSTGGCADVGGPGAHGRSKSMVVV